MLLKSPLNMLSSIERPSRNIFLPNIERCIIKNDLINTVKNASTSNKQIFNTEKMHDVRRSYKNIQSIIEKDIKIQWNLWENCKRK